MQIQNKSITFLGLGAMGYWMAGHLAKKLGPITVYNRSLPKANDWQKEFAGIVETTPAKAAAGKKLVMLCVSRDEDVRAVVAGPEGVLKSAAPGTVIVDHSTTSATLAVELSALALHQGVYFIDAPVSGGTIGAQRGQLTVMFGGVEAAVEEAKQAVNCYAKFCQYMGKSGHGQLAKMANQILIFGVLQSLSEGIAFAEKAGLNVADWKEAVKHGASQSWQLENRAETMHQRKFDFGFKVDLARKDIGIIKAAAQALGAKIPMTLKTDTDYEKLQNQGCREFDTSCLMKLFDEP